MPFRRQRSWQRRVKDAARRAPQRGRELRAAAAQLDLPWARSLPAGVVRENFMRFVLNPVMDYYAARRATGREQLSGLRQPVILVANHASHMDTPVILSALPRRLRKRTAVAAAADYFYRNRLLASIVSLIFNTVPIERNNGGGGLSKDGSHLDSLLDQGWNLLLYPEGTRSRGGVPGRVRRGAAVLASAHNLTIIPIRVSGTAAAMPPGRMWPKRLRGRVLSKRHRIEVSFGEPIPPASDTAALIERVQSFFDSAPRDGGPSLSPYRRHPVGSGSRRD
ncbi:MAG: lysophospholipid acyltransferase family protein [Solirubrobacteraceae bacterium]